ncbi:hypothetical protein MXB_691 [Myxobolus squamalis]|nr:hypothetical protein MXB_691 [Myxobolus squamalis]
MPNNTVILIANTTVEIYHVYKSSLNATLVQTLKTPSHWDVFEAKNKILILATGDLCTTLKFITLEKKTVTNTVLLHITPKSQNFVGLTRKNVTLVTLYDLKYITITGISDDFIHIYFIGSEINHYVELRYRIKIENGGTNFTISVIDNVLGIHDFVRISSYIQTNKVTLMYDIYTSLESKETTITTCVELIEDISNVIVTKEVDAIHHF